MEHLWTTLTRAMEGTPAIAIGASFLWGILSVVLSPCHLSSIPLVVAFVGGQGVTTPRKAFGYSSLFAVGILATIAMVGAATAGARQMMGDVGSWAGYFVAGVFLIIGLYLLDILPLSWSGSLVQTRRKGYAAAFILGLVFGIAVGPCTFAYMGPVLMVTFNYASTKLAFALSLLLAYGIGHCSVIVLAGTSLGLVQRYLNWTEQSAATSILRKVCGVLVLIAGLYMVYKA